MASAHAQTGIQLAHVPYKGSAPLLQDLSGGRADFAVLVYSAGLGALVDQGRLKVVGQLGAQCSELLKNVPAMSETRSLKRMNFRVWIGFLVPSSTPADAVQKLHAAVGKTLQDPALRQ